MCGRNNYDKLKLKYISKKAQTFNDFAYGEVDYTKINFYQAV